MSDVYDTTAINVLFYTAKLLSEEVPIMENFLPSSVRRTNGSNVWWETFGNPPFLPVKEFVAQKKSSTRREGRGRGGGGGPGKGPPPLPPMKGKKGKRKRAEDEATAGRRLTAGLLGLHHHHDGERRRGRTDGRWSTNTGGHCACKQN